MEKARERERARGTGADTVDGDLGFRGHMVSRGKKAVQKRRQKLGVSAGDISGLKLSRRSRHVLRPPAPCALRMVTRLGDSPVRVWHRVLR